MRIDLSEARVLLEGAMHAVDYSQDEAAVIADHLLDCELRGLGYAGLARAVAIVEHIHKTNLQRKPIVLTKETPVSAQLDGGNNLGYLVARQATDMAIKKASTMGIGAVGASKTYYTGMFSYYLEKVAQAGFAGMIVGSGLSVVAPFGGVEPRFCTNPIAFGFPSNDVPVIWDIGTSSVTHAEVILAKRLGIPLAQDIAFDSDGAPTTDAASVLDGGAVTAWGGHRGSGLALSIQLLSMMVGQVNIFTPSDDPMDCGYLIVVFDPEMFGAVENFRAAVSEYVEIVGDTKPVDPAQPVRVPFARSFAERSARREEGAIEVDDLVAATIRGICGKN